jgi:hypothetical protein
MVIQGVVTDRKAFSWVIKQGDRAGQTVHKQRVGLRLPDSGERIEVILPPEPVLDIDKPAAVDIEMRQAVFAEHAQLAQLKKAA